MRVGRGVRQRAYQGQEVQALAAHGHAPVHHLDGFAAQFFPLPWQVVAQLRQVGGVVAVAGRRVQLVQVEGGAHAVHAVQRRGQVAAVALRLLPGGAGGGGAAVADLATDGFQRQPRQAGEIPGGAGGGQNQGVRLQGVVVAQAHPHRPVVGGGLELADGGKPQFDGRVVQQLPAPGRR